MMYYFINPEVRRGAIANMAQVEQAFKDLCVQENFRSSIEGTTKSIDAIYTRLRLWGEALNSLNISAVLPRLIDNKITRG
jgi:hypothetical protein